MNSWAPFSLDESHHLRLDSGRRIFYQTEEPLARGSSGGAGGNETRRLSGFGVEIGPGIFDQSWVAARKLKSALTRTGPDEQDPKRMKTANILRELRTSEEKEWVVRQAAGFMLEPFLVAFNRITNLGELLDPLIGIPDMGPSPQTNKTAFDAMAREAGQN